MLTLELTLEGAIKHHREKAEELRKQGSICCDSLEDTIRAEKCLECATEHDQYAEWLTELQDFRKRQSQLEHEKRTLEYEKRIAWAVTNITPDEITFQGKRYILKEEEC